MQKNDIILQKKNLSVLLRAVASKHQCDSYSINCLHFVVTEKRVESHK